MKVVLSSVPPDLVRCSQCGDWNYTDDSILAFVRNDISPDSQFAIAIHEAVEAWLCRRHGVTDKEVVDFDTAFESKRKKGNRDEAGDDPKSPYRLEHMAATHVERAVCSALGLDWDAHENEIPE